MALSGWPQIMLALGQHKFLSFFVPSIVDDFDMSYSLMLYYACTAVLLSSAF